MAKWIQLGQPPERILSVKGFSQSTKGWLKGWGSQRGRVHSELHSSLSRGSRSWAQHCLGTGALSFSLQRLSCSFSSSSQERFT